MARAGIQDLACASTKANPHSSQDKALAHDTTGPARISLEGVAAAVEQGPVPFVLLGDTYLHT
jgi:hypothetical protein